MSSFFFLTGAFLWACFALVALVVVGRYLAAEWHTRSTITDWAEVFGRVFVEDCDRGLYTKLVKRALANERVSQIKAVWAQRPSVKRREMDQQSFNSGAVS